MTCSVSQCILTKAFSKKKMQIKNKAFTSLFLGATGSVLRKIDGMKKRPYYYALSLAGVLCFNNNTCLT